MKKKKKKKDNCTYIHQELPKYLSIESERIRKFRSQPSDCLQPSNEVNVKMQKQGQLELGQ